MTIEERLRLAMVQAVQTFLKVMQGTDPKEQVDYTKWLSTKQVARTLNITTKTVDRYRKEKHIRSHKLKRGGRGPIVRVYHPGDVDGIR